MKLSIQAWSWTNAKRAALSKAYFEPMSFFCFCNRSTHKQMANLAWYFLRSTPSCLPSRTTCF